MTAWDMWASVPKVLLKLLSQPQALSPEAFPAIPSLTGYSLPPQLLYPLGSPRAQGRHWPWSCSPGIPGPHWGPGSSGTELLPSRLSRGPCQAQHLP